MMQDKKLNRQSKRTFADIWSALSRAERHDLIALLIVNLDVSYPTVWNWGKGRIPVAKPVRDMAATVVSEFLNTEVSPDELFPRK